MDGFVARVRSRFWRMDAGAWLGFFLDGKGRAVRRSGQSPKIGILGFGSGGGGGSVDRFGVFVAVFEGAFGLLVGFEDSEYEAFQIGRIDVAVIGVLLFGHAAQHPPVV